MENLLKLTYNKMNSIETKKPYEKPQIEVIEIANEAPLLVASDPKQYGKQFN